MLHPVIAKPIVFDYDVIVFDHDVIVFDHRLLQMDTGSNDYNFRISICAVLPECQETSLLLVFLITMLLVR